jgi:hypothetical protein
VNLYRAIYRTKAGRVRKMTIASQDIKAAHRLAELWELSDDKLQAVAVVRPLNQQMTFNLTH